MRYHSVPASILRPVVRAALLYWCVLTLTFVLLRLAPGDTASLLVSPGASISEVARLRMQLGLDQPMAVQYARWLRESLGGSMGTSFTAQRAVRDVIADALPISLGLGLTSLLLSFVIGIAAGLIQAAHRGRLDAVLTVASVVLVASPAYWLGLGAIACFTYLASSWSLPLGLRLPAIGIATPGADLHGMQRFADLLRHSILPVSLLSAIGAGGVARYVRTSALDAVGADWMRTARAKGVNAVGLYRHHLLANLRAPLLTLFALAVPGTVAGSVFVETIFAWPGIGRLMVTSIVARDYPVVMGCTMMFAAIVIIANLLAEALLPWADPRIRA